MDETKPAGFLAEDDILARFTRGKPAFMDILGAEFTGADPAQGTARITYEVGYELCHSGNIVQGGFITAMLDATMAHAIFAASSFGLRPPTLEIKVSFFEPAHPGKLECMARIVRRGRSIAFLEADLHDASGQLLARGTSTVKLVAFEKNSAEK